MKEPKYYEVLYKRCTMKIYTAYTIDNLEVWGNRELIEKIMELQDFIEFVQANKHLSDKEAIETFLRLQEMPVA